MEDGIPVIKKTDLQKDSMPLCVAINKRQDILVGDTAWNILKSNKILKHVKFNSECFTGFTRTLGTTHTYESSNANKSFTSEELLGECFKKLKSFISDELVESVVITVPDKFLNPQNEAVVRAGKLAGFKQIALIQESIATSLGYGLRIGTNIVFDFGKTEFKVALVKNNNICDSEIENWLGGSNFEERIIDKIIIPYLKVNYDIGSLLVNSEKKEILRNSVIFFAEEIFEQLFSKVSINILSNLGDLPFEDDNGAEPEIDIKVSQQDLAFVTRPIFQKAIDITEDLLNRNNLKGKDIDGICLVGKLTQSPVFQYFLKEQITLNVDTFSDSSTIVGKGAALFASTISVSGEVKETLRDTTKLQLDIKYEATSVEMDEMLNLKVLKEKTTRAIPERLFIVLDRISKGVSWSSTKKEISLDKANLIQDIQLEQGEANTFSILLSDKFGNNIECQPNQFTIIQGIGGLDGMQVLPYHIGVAKYFHIEGKELFMPVKGLEKNKDLPATGVINGFKTKFDLRPGIISDVIILPIYQGDYNAEGTDPLLNNHVVDIVISGESLPALLPLGSDIDITIKVDKSQLMTFTAYIPYLNHTEELVIEIKQTEPPTAEFLFKEISKAKRTAQRLNATDVSEKIEVLEEQLENGKASTDVKLKIFDGLRKELLKLDSAEKAAEWPKIEQAMKDAFYDLEKRFNNKNTISEYRIASEILLKEKNLNGAKSILLDIKELLKDKNIDYDFIDNLKGELVLFYSDNPSMGKERFRFHLGELIRIEKGGVIDVDKVKVVDSVKKELLKWK